MSAHRNKGKTERVDRKESAAKARISREVAASLEATRMRAKDGLLVLCIEVGPGALEMMFEKEPEEAARRVNTTPNRRTRLPHPHVLPQSDDGKAAPIMIEST